MSKQEYLRRYIFFFVGLYIISMGIALSTKGGLGVTPVSSIPYALSLGTPLTLGNITIIVQLIYIACEIAILRKDFKLIDLLQFAVVFVYGYFNDFSCYLVSGLNPHNYIEQWALCILAMFVIAFGIKMEVSAGVMMLPVDGLMALISRKWKIDFGKVKITFDSSQVVIAVISSFLLMGRLEGVREGTVAAAIFVGMIIKMYTKRLAKFYEFCGLTPIAAAKAKSAEEAAEEAIARATVRVITIGREAGSGGLEIGQLLAKKLGVPCYNKDLLGLTAEAHGTTIGHLEEHENKILRFFEQINDENYAPIMEQFNEAESVLTTQQEVMAKVGSTESCVIVGRMGNYYLKHHPHCYHVFLYAKEDYRIKHYAEEFQLSYEDAKEKVRALDERRRTHYEMYTGGQFGEYGAYHLSVDTSALGSEQTAEVIFEAANKYFGQ